MINNAGHRIFFKCISYSVKKYLLKNVVHIRKSSSLTMTAIEVTVKQGKLRGVIRDNIDGGQYCSFRGIPYAEPPIGELRFKDPQLPKSWSGIRDALDESKCSAQFDLASNVSEGGDDCLYLDIATNSITEKRPVMVWIHGGAFKRSSNTYKKYSPDYLLKKDIVFVSINYRLGVLGFLNMENEECPGNQGLKDQIAALKWINENIENFGGNSENITIFGESAGGASVHALCLSSQAKGLFHKAITQSGVLSNPWAHISSNKEYGYSLAEALGKKCETSEEVTQYLRTIPALKLVEEHEKINSRESAKLLLSLVPSIDSKSADPIIPEPVYILEKKGVDVPLLIGYNSHEGIIMFLSGSERIYKRINNDFDSVIAENLKIKDKGKISNYCKIIRDFYFGKGEINKEKIDELVQFFGDMVFVNNILGVAEIQQEKITPTYLYKYSYESDFPGMKDRFNVKIKGTCHSDEMGSLFYSELRREKLKEGTRDRKTMERMTTMWTNFAKYGNPTPSTDDLITTEWLPIGENNKHYLEINDNLTYRQNPDEKIWITWKHLLIFSTFCNDL